jgi:exodeoxyribonuclease-3
VVRGQRTYNGVAVLGREVPRDARAGPGGDPGDDEARLVAAKVGGVLVVSAYVPNGRLVGSDQWAYKLEWLARLKVWLAREASPDEPVLVCGDFNVAPEDRDVARPEEWRDTVLTHQEARAALRDLLSWGLVDVVRVRHEGPGPFTWWDYRQLAFPKGNGLRIDHVFATRPLAERCTAARVDRDERKGKLPSDHAPVIAEFDLDSGASR